MDTQTLKIELTAEQTITFLTINLKHHLFSWESVTFGVLNGWNRTWHKIFHIYNIIARESNELNENFFLITTHHNLTFAV